MVRRIRTVVAFLVALGSVATSVAQEPGETQELKKYPLLSRLDIPTEDLPKGCSKPDLQPDDFPVQGLRQCAVTTNSNAIAAIDKRATKVGAESIDAMHYAVYREAGELGVVGLAFKDAQVAKEASDNLARVGSAFRTWRRDHYVIWLWRDTGTTDECMQQIATNIERILQHFDAKDD